jgi:hypothetical protein
MKKYRCVFTYARGTTTIDVVAHDADAALVQAQTTVADHTATDIEIWDETGLVSTRRGKSDSLPKH